MRICRLGEGPAIEADRRLCAGSSVVERDSGMVLGQVDPRQQESSKQATRALGDHGTAAACAPSDADRNGALPELGRCADYVISQEDHSKSRRSTSANVNWHDDKGHGRIERQAVLRSTSRAEWDGSREPLTGAARRCASNASARSSRPARIEVPWSLTCSAQAPRSFWPWSGRRKPATTIRRRPAAGRRRQAHRLPDQRGHRGCSGGFRYMPEAVRHYASLPSNDSRTA